MVSMTVMVRKNVLVNKYNLDGQVIILQCFENDIRFLNIAQNLERHIRGGTPAHWGWNTLRHGRVTTFHVNNVYDLLIHAIISVEQNK